MRRTFTMIVTAMLAAAVTVFVPSGNAVAAIPPEMPRSISAVGGDQQVSLYFSPPPSTGDSPIVRYEATVDGGTSGSTMPTTGTDSLAGTVTGLANGVTYQVSIRAVNDAGPGPWSYPVQVPVAALPGPPLQVSAYGGPSRVFINWSPPASNGGGAVMNYVLRAVPAGGGDPVTELTGPSDTQGAIWDLTNGTTYVITVAAQNSTGIGSWSAPVTAVPADAVVLSSKTVAAVHVSDVYFDVPVSATLSQPRTQLYVGLRATATGRIEHFQTITRSTEGTQFTGKLSIFTGNLKTLGPHQWVLTPQNPAQPSVVATSVRLHSLLGLKLTRSGTQITVTGSARAYHTVLNQYVAWAGRPVAVQRWTKNGWTTLTTVTTDARGNLTTRLTLPWTSGIRLQTPDVDKIWGAATAQQVI